MCYQFRDYWGFELRPSSGIIKTQKNTTFRKLDLFPSSGEVWEAPTLFGLLERADLRCLYSCCYTDIGWPVIEVRYLPTLTRERKLVQFPKRRVL
jgi:hypothetical protein